MKSYDVAILGAGASGLVASILLARANFNVLLIERQSRGGKKILASGNGRCNITNRNISKINFHANNKSLIDSLIKEYSLNDIIDFFNTIGLDIIFNQDGRAFPKSLSASSVLELLEAEVKRQNISTIYNAKDISIKSDFKLNIEKIEYIAKYIIIATGSIAAPQLGGSSSGLDIAKRLGHKIIEPLPALTPLISSNSIDNSIHGLKLDCKVKLIVNSSEITSKSGDLLFTKYGLSGLVVLDLSIEVAKAFRGKKRVTLEIDFMQDIKEKELISYYKKRINKERNLPLELWLGATINPKLSKHLLKVLNLIGKYESDLNIQSIKNIVKLIKGYRVRIDSLREPKYAEVALGGVDSKDLDSYTLESKIVKNLYFIGEILDTVGDRGGYNFTFAWFSAFRVSKYLKSKRLIKS